MPSQFCERLECQTGKNLSTKRMIELTHQTIQAAWPISLTTICCKIMEQIIYHSVIEHLNQYNILNRFQYGFRQGFSCEAQLASVVEDILFAMDNLHQVDLILLDFCKAFDTVPHYHLLLKLQLYGITNKTHTWITSWLTLTKSAESCDRWSSFWMAAC